MAARNEQEEWACAERTGSKNCKLREEGNLFFLSNIKDQKEPSFETVRRHANYDLGAPNGATDPGPASSGTEPPRPDMQLSK